MAQTALAAVAYATSQQTFEAPPKSTKQYLIMARQFDLFLIFQQLIRNAIFFFFQKLNNR